MCKSIENQKSKICTKPILSSTYIEESKNVAIIIIKTLTFLDGCSKRGCFNGTCLIFVFAGRFSGGLKNLC